jgi:hypothetical protein
MSTPLVAMTPSKTKAPAVYRRQREDGADEADVD